MNAVDIAAARLNVKRAVRDLWATDQARATEGLAAAEVEVAEAEDQLREALQPTDEQLAGWLDLGIALPRGPD